MTGLCPAGTSALCAGHSTRWGVPASSPCTHPSGAGLLLSRCLHAEPILLGFPGCFQATNNGYFGKTPFFSTEKPVLVPCPQHSQAAPCAPTALYSTPRHTQLKVNGPTLIGDQAHDRSLDHAVNHFIPLFSHTSLVSSDHKCYRTEHVPPL